MIHRFDSTGRLADHRDAILIRVFEDPAGGPSRFPGRPVLSCEKSSSPRLRRSWVEPYVRQSSMRFDFGTVGSVMQPADTTLTEITGEKQCTSG